MTTAGHTTHMQTLKKVLPKASKFSWPKALAEKNRQVSPIIIKKRERNQSLFFMAARRPFPTPFYAENATQKSSLFLFDCSHRLYRPASRHNF